MASIFFYDSTELDEQQLSSGLEGTDHEWHFVSEPISLENIDPKAEVISVFVTSTVTAEIIEALPNLRLIACRSTGYNNIDFRALESRNITVVNVPSYGEATVAEYAFCLILALLRKLPRTLKSFDDEINTLELMGTDLSGKTIGIIGAGRIGQHVIMMAKGFQMQVLAFDPYPKEGIDVEMGFEFVELDDLLKRSDVVSIHAPYVGSNKHIIDDAALSKMKPSAYLVNTARGELVDTKALTEALQEKRIAGAALDVIEGEKLMHVDEEVTLLRSSRVSTELFENSVELLALHKMPNVILTPHNAFNSVEAVGRINSTTTNNIIRFWYEDIPNIVTPPKNNFGKLILTRHSESEWNASGKWTGITDVHLSEKGFHEATLLGLALKDMEVEIDQAYCSQQIRTLETLEGILNASQQFDVAYERTSAVNERDYGDYTGKNKWEMRDLIGEKQFNSIRRGWNVPVPGGETLKDVYERVVPFYKNHVLPQLMSGKNILIVGHGNSLRSLMKYIEKISDKDVGNLEMIFGEIISYEVDGLGHMLNKQVKSIDSPKINA